MTTLVQREGMASALRLAWSGRTRVERVAYVVGLVLIISGIAHAGVLLVSRGTWSGPLSLRKPTTFGLSFGLTLITVAWATSFLTIGAAVRTLLLGLFTAASVVETTLVTTQAWRGVPSHFNFETEFDTTISMTLAAGGGVIIVTALAFTAFALIRSSDVQPSLRLALRFGFVVLLVALGTGALMIADGVSLARSGDPEAAYATAGALKPLHGVTMHAILVVPALAWMLRLAAWSERRRMQAVAIAASVYTTVIVAVAIAQ